MKAAMDENGVITLSAESSVEAYALDRWSREAYIRLESATLAESYFYRGSRLLVISSQCAAASIGKEGE